MGGSESKNTYNGAMAHILDSEAGPMSNLKGFGRHRFLLAHSYLDSWHLIFIGWILDIEQVFRISQHISLSTSQQVFSTS
jgi:hypothetical protein